MLLERRMVFSESLYAEYVYTSLLDATRNVVRYIFMTMNIGLSVYISV